MEQCGPAVRAPGGCGSFGGGLLLRRFAALRQAHLEAQLALHLFSIFSQQLPATPYFLSLLKGVPPTAMFSTQAMAFAPAQLGVASTISSTALALPAYQVSQFPFVPPTLSQPAMPTNLDLAVEARLQGSKAADARLLSQMARDPRLRKGAGPPAWPRSGVAQEVDCSAYKALDQLFAPPTEFPPSTSPAVPAGCGGSLEVESRQDSPGGAESVESILAQFGLSSEDLELLTQYPDEQLTPETLPVILRTIGVLKAKPAPPGSTPATHLSHATAPSPSPSSAPTPPNTVKREPPSKDSPSSTSVPVPKKRLGVAEAHDASCITKKPSPDRQSRTDIPTRGRTPNPMPSAKARREPRSRAAEPAYRLAFPLKSPTPTMISDYVAAPPKIFPHICSLCSQVCVSSQDWLQHQNTSQHIESCRCLRKKYPDWSPNPRRCSREESRPRPARSPSWSPSPLPCGRGQRYRSRSPHKEHHPLKPRRQSQTPPPHHSLPHSSSEPRSHKAHPQLSSESLTKMLTEATGLSLESLLQSLTPAFLTQLAKAKAPDAAKASRKFSSMTPKSCSSSSSSSSARSSLVRSGSSAGPTKPHRPTEQATAPSNSWEKNTSRQRQMEPSQPSSTKNLPSHSPHKQAPSTKNLTPHPPPKQAPSTRDNPPTHSTPKHSIPQRDNSPKNPTPKHTTPQQDNSPTAGPLGTPGPETEELLKALLQECRARARAPPRGPALQLRPTTPCPDHPAGQGEHCGYHRQEASCTGSHPSPEHMDGGTSGRQDAGDEDSLSLDLDEFVTLDEVEEAVEEAEPSELERCGPAPSPDPPRDGEGEESVEDMDMLVTLDQVGTLDEEEQPLTLIPEAGGEKTEEEAGEIKSPKIVSAAAESVQGDQTNESLVRVGLEESRKVVRQRDGESCINGSGAVRTKPSSRVRHSDNWRGKERGQWKRRMEVHPSASSGPVLKKARSEPLFPLNYQMPPFSPDCPVGMDFLVPKTGFFCKLCNLFYSGDMVSRETHCSSLKHYQNMEKCLQRWREKQSIKGPVLEKQSIKGPVLEK